MSFNLHCLFFIPCFAVRRLSSPFLVSGGQVSSSPESPLPLPPVIYLFHHKAVWSCPLFLSKRFLTSWGKSAFLLPSSHQPALLPNLAVALAGAPWPQHRGLPPLPSFSTSAGALAVPLSQTVNRDSSLAGPGAMCEWTEGRHPWAARRFQPGGDVPRCLGVTRVSFSLAVKVWGHPEMRFE